MLDRLSPRPGARQKKKRVGRGPGTGLQKTAGRGTKGQGKRSPGRETPLYHEGGQMPMTRRIPKRGFTNIHRVPHAVVNVGDLATFGEWTVAEVGTAGDDGARRLAAGVRVDVLDGRHSAGRVAMALRMIPRTFSRSAPSMARRGGRVVSLQRPVSCAASLMYWTSLTWVSRWRSGVYQR